MQAIKSPPFTYRLLEIFVKQVYYVVVGSLVSNVEKLFNFSKSYTLQFFMTEE